MASLVLACVVILLSIIYLYKRYTRKYRPLPGPKGIPIFGNILQMDLRRLSTEVSRLVRNYGDVCTIQLFTQHVVLVNSYEAIREALMSEKYSHVFSGRPVTFVRDFVFKYDVAMSTFSKEWTALRKTAHRGLRTYGSHLVEVEELVQEELKNLMARMQREAGTVVDPKDYIDGYVISIISMLLTGQHHKYDDPLLKHCHNVAQHLDYLMSPDVSALMTSLPWLRIFPVGCGKVYQQVQNDIFQVKKIVFDELMNKEKKTCFFEHILEEKNKLTEDMIHGLLADVVTGGTGTSTASLYALVLVLATNPKIQKRVQEEIDEEIGTSRLPCIQDKHRMPYSHAVLLELFRFYPVAPLALPHCTMEDVEFRGYSLPKDTVIFYSLWNIQHDETFWKDAWTFNPSRFLDDEGNIVPPEHENRRRLLTFGIGKRQCIGEILARLRIFLALVAILQKFTILPDPENPLPDADPRTFNAHLFLTAPPYKVVFQSRE